MLVPVAQPPRAFPLLWDFYPPSYRKWDGAHEMFTWVSSAGRMMNPAGPERSLADATALSRLCQGSCCRRRAPLSPACPLTNESMPAARCPLLHLEQSSFAHQRFPFSAAFVKVTIAQTAPVIIMRSLNANINHGAEKQAWHLPLLQKACVRVHPRKACDLGIAFRV